MTKYLMAVLLGAALLATPAQAVEWKTDTTDRTDASVRMLFVKEIKMHHAEVVAAKKHRRLMREKRAAEAAAEAAAAATPTVTTTTAPSISYSGGWSEELAAVGFPASVIPTMLGIIDRESGGCPTAVNGLSGCPSYEAAAGLLASSESHACGLIQAYPCYGGAAWLDPMTNLRVGFQKYQASGLAPWGG